MTEYFIKEGESYVKVKESLHTQEDLDRVVGERLDREKKKYSNYDTLVTQVDTLTKELENGKKAWSTEKSELETNLKKAGLETSRVKVISEFKLSDELSEFVTGDTEDEMRTRAEKLAKGIKPASITIDKDEKPEEKGNSSKALAGKLFGGKSDD